MAALDVKRFPVPIRGDIDPTLTRRGGRNNRAGYGLTLIACLFTAYAFGYLPWLDAAFERTVYVTQSKQAAVAGAFEKLLPYIAGCVASLLLMLAALQVKRLVRRLRIASFLRDRPTTAVESFIAEAERAGVRRKVARETYHLLEPHYGRTMRIQPEDRLVDDLRLSEYAILDIGGNLLQRCDRTRRTGEILPSAPTVLELMQFVQRSRPAFVEISEGFSRPQTSAQHPAFIPPVRLQPESLAAIRKPQTYVPLRIK